MIGKSLSHFEITAQLGKGGMGEVYRAEDTKLGREVAIKVLPAELASDPARLERFEREARAVAALDHPNIVTVHEIAQDGDTHFIAMQLIDGQTLGEAIPSGGMALDQIFATVVPIADALSAAHEAGVIHRDLKPGNIMIGGDGRVRILDFGLAKLQAGSEQRDSTQLGTEVLTSEGQIIGTVAYMSPEQAEGKPIDQRSDIFSLGVLLYQMASGVLPFHGDTQISTITSILRDAPVPVTQVRVELPWHLGRIVKRALEKDPERRYQMAKDLRNDLEGLKLELDSGELSDGGEELQAAGEAAAARGPAPSDSAGVKVWGLTALLLAAGLVVGFLFGRQADESGSPGDASAGVRLTQISVGTGFESWPSLTPDGEWVVYGAREAKETDIFLQSVGGYKPINLTEDSPVDDSQPCLSPDGQTIAFRSERQGGGIFVMGRTGESVRRVADFGFSPTWSPDGQSLVVATEQIPDMPYSRSSVSQLWRLDLETGEKTLLTDGDAVEPSWSPGGARIAFWGLPRNTGQRDIFTIPATGGDPQPLTNDSATDWSPSWSADGHDLYFASDRSGAMNIWRLPIDETTGKALGPPEQITTGGAFWSVRPSFSRDGRRMAYSEGRWRYDVYRLPLDPTTGRAAGALELVFGDSRNTVYPAISPDGEWLAFSTSVGQQEDLYVSRLDGSGLTRLTDDPAKDRGAKWSPDGERLAFYSDRSGTYSLWAVNVDGSGLERLETPKATATETPVWSPDGSQLVYQVRDEVAGSIFAAIFDLSRPSGEDNPRQLPLPPAGKMNYSPQSWSRDGDRILGYFEHSDGSPAELAVYSVSSEEYQIFDHQADSPMWLSDGRRAIVEADQSFELLDTVTGEATVLLTVGPGTIDDFPSISSDDRWVYFTLATPEFDIWIAELGQRAR